MPTGGAASLDLRTSVPGWTESELSLNGSSSYATTGPRGPTGAHHR